jgi:DNA-binding NarL/FixJ family response regulator
MTSILLVEDHAIFAQAIKRVLKERAQIDIVAVAESAEEALEKLPGLQIDLVLVDVSLPQTSGISLVIMLHEKYPELPCVMLSGHVSQHYARNSLAAGARGYLVKDQTEEILRGIERVLQGEIFVSEEVR